MQTEYFEIKSQDDVIWCAYDYEKENIDAPLVVIAPGYEKTARESLMMSLYMVQNGFRVLRFDTRNSNGLSTGDIKNFTMSSLIEDLDIVLNYAKKNMSSGHGISLIALSLSCRALLKYLSMNNKNKDILDLVITIVGVVDLEYTFEQILNENYVKDYLKGERFGTRKLLTYDINWDSFLEDANSLGMLDYEMIKEEAKNISQSNFFAILAGNDEWNDIERQMEINTYIGSGQVEQFVIEHASHQIWKNPKCAEISMKKCVCVLKKYLYDEEVSMDKVNKPDITLVISENRKEREIIRTWKERRNETCS